MRVSEFVVCHDFPCTDVNHAACTVPCIELDPQLVKIMMVSEAAPGDPADYFYAGEHALFARTTLLAFQDAGLQVSTIEDLLAMGIYFTTAVKCGKSGYAIQSDTVKQCARLLEQEIELFPQVKVYMLMGDVAIKAVNEIARRGGERRVIPAGATYKLRGGEFTFRGQRALPSYVQAGPSFFIEKSKRRMIAEDIRTALALAGIG